LSITQGEFDIEWGKTITYANNYEWYNTEIDQFYAWLEQNGRDPQDPKLSLGYLKLGQVNHRESFGTTHEPTIHQLLSNHLDIYRIEVGDTTNTFDYCWSDHNYKQMQIDMMRPGYEHSSRG
jgi:hypothetical protein